MEIVILLALILLNGIFAMSEIALATARKARLQTLIDRGDASAIAAAKLGEDPTRYLSTIQIGITSIGVLNGIVGEARFAGPMTDAFVSLGVRQPYAEYAGTAVVVVLITYFSIVLGELVPKRLGQTNPEAIARLVAKPVMWLARLSKPFVHLLTVSTHVVMRMIRISTRSPPAVTEAEIHAMLAEGSETGVIEKQEHVMVRNVFRLDDRLIASLMVPRGDIVTLDVDRPFEESLQRIEATDHSHYPVTRGGLSDIVGVASARRILAGWLRSRTQSIATDVVPALFVPETVTGMELLENFRATDRRVAFVVDEYGEVLGMVTLYDVVEAITGEFNPRNPETAWATERDDGSWLLDGLIPLPDLKDRLELAALPEEDRGRYHTLSGMLMLLLGRLPQTGDATDWEGWRFEIVDLDGRKIDKVLASRLEPERPQDDPGPSI